MPHGTAKVAWNSRRWVLIMAASLATDSSATPATGAQGTSAATHGTRIPQCRAAFATRPPVWTGVSGFVDIHCHLLSGLDDGPADDDASLQLAAAAHAGGTAAIVATPHHSFRFPFRHDDVQRGLKRLEQLVSTDLALFTGCELEINDESLRGFGASPERVTLNQGR